MLASYSIVQEFESLLDYAEGKVSEDLAVLTYKRDTSLEGHRELKCSIDSRTEEYGYLRQASIFLNELIQVVSASNIARIEQVINSALESVFFDQKLCFKIIPGIKREKAEYSFGLEEYETSVGGEPKKEQDIDSIEGDIDSFGGGVYAVLAFVLKVLFNIFLAREPFLILDESLSFLSEEYIPGMAKFINELSDEFEICILLVTQLANIKFIEYSKTVYHAVPYYSQTNFKECKFVRRVKNKGKTL